MDFILQFADVFIHLDKHLSNIIQHYGVFTYLILFLVIYCETGLVVTPFLPGDSLLFAAGSFAAIGAFDIVTLYFILLMAPIMGDSTNYWIGHHIGPKIFYKENVRFLNKKYLDKTHGFYERHGGKAVIIARFMPIMRTFTPFVAGIGRMNYFRFLSFSIAGSFFWISSFVLGGYWFGNIPIIKNNFTLAILAIILISITPGIIAYLKHKNKS